MFPEVFTVFFSFIFLAHGRSNSSASLYIAGGVTVDISEYPYQVSLTLDEYLCGGSILNNEFILTAAHCTHDKSASSVKVRAGSNYSYKDGIEIAVKNIFEHGQFDKETFDNDIALIQLKTPLEFDKTKKPVQLPPADYPLEDGMLTYVTGFGNLSPEGPLSDSLQMVELPVITTETCQAIYGDEAITENMFCAGYTEGGKDACEGDSGGPLVSDGMILGVISFGPPCASAGYPGGYTKVSKFRAFIDSIMNQ